METYFMFGKYSPEAIKGISGKRTEEAVSLIKRLGGKVQDVYALLGPYDLAFVVDFPGTEEALKASLALSRLTGIGFLTSPAMKVEDFDKIATGL
jgi:uncharacterized protein with GYD domain